MRFNYMHLIRNLSALAMAVVIASCDAGRLTNPPEALPPAGDPATSVASIIITPDSVDMAVGDIVRLSAAAYDQSGTLIQGREVQWVSTSGNSRVTVNTDGTLEAVQVGVDTVFARLDGRTGNARLRISVPRVAAVIVRLTPTTVEVGQNAQATASLYDQRGDAIQANTFWTSTQRSVATVDQNGLVTAKAPGTTRIAVVSGGKVDSEELTVTNARAGVPATVLVTSPAALVYVGKKVQLSATVRDGNGALIPSAGVTWSTSNSGIGTISSAGEAEGIAVGTVSFTATSGGKSGATTISVALAPVNTVTLALQPATIVLGSSTSSVGSSVVAPPVSQAIATTYDQDGTVLEGRTVVYSSSNASVATVSLDGVVTGLIPGASSITATSEGKSASAAITINPAPIAPVASVSVVLTSPSLQVGATTQALASPLDADGQPLTGRSMTWSSSSPSVATVSASGVVTAVGQGTSSIGVTSEGKTGLALVTVVPAVVLTGIEISPASATLNAGEGRTYTALGRRSDGSTVAATVSWSATGGNITQQGNYTAGQVAGHFLVIAACACGVSDTSALEILVSAPAPTLTAITVAPAAVTLATGDSVQISANGWMSGSVTPVSTPVLWSASGGSVSQAGKYKAGNTAGTYYVRAQSTLDASKKDSTRVTITSPAPPPPPATPTVQSVTLTPSSVSLLSGVNQQFQASVNWSNGTTTSTGIAYTATGGSISAAGLYTAGSAAGTYRVIASSGGRADTSTVSLTLPPPPPPPPPAATANECAAPRVGWVWCDDFEQNRLSSYFEVDDAGGRFNRTAGVGHGSSYGMRASFGAGTVNAGGLKLAFGRTPQAYFRSVAGATVNYREVYWRLYLRNASGWTGGGGDKLSRATIFASSSSWAQAMIAHVWSGGSSNLVIDPASGTNAAGNLITTTYNDFANLRWLGGVAGATPLFSSQNVGSWQCVETHVRLNDAGQSNGVFEMWVNGSLDARKTGLNWVGNYSAYGINAIFVENYWNAGSPANQNRDIDRLVISTQPIGCDGSTTPPPTTPPPTTPPPTTPPPTTPPPTTPPTVQSVALTPSSASLVAGNGQQFQATVAWSDGSNSTTGLSFAATGGTVSSGGYYTAGSAAGSYRVIASVGGKADTSALTVSVPASPPPPPAGSAPVPSGDIVFDTRAGGANSIQNMTTKEQMQAGYDVRTTGPVTQFLELNLDGQGTHARGIAWGAARVDEQEAMHSRNIAAPSSGWYTAWKMQLGRTPTSTGVVSPGNDPNVPVGAMGAFGLNQLGGTNAHQKTMIWGRGNGADRIYLVIRPSDTKFSSDGLGWSSPHLSVNPYLMTGQVQSWVVYMQPSTGTIRCWLNGALVMSATGQNLGSTGLTSIAQTVTTFPAFQETQYMWDFVVWR